MGMKLNDNNYYQLFEAFPIFVQYDVDIAII